MGRTQLSVILMILCAGKCLTMSHDELEDFAEYLQRTSQLSPILKKGVEADAPDDNEVVSDDAWEESGKFEGDLVLNERQRRLIVQSIADGLARNGIRDGTKRWPNNEVIYFIQVEHFKHDQVEAIHNAIDDLQRASCVKFRPYRKGDPDAVVIQGSRRGCFSQVGYQGGYQVLNLSGRHPTGRGCFRHGTIIHEMLHTLGFYHMQSSPVRDDYVDIVWDNIVQAARHNFRKYNSFSVSNFGVTYDYDSVLHYSKHAFSVNGKDTIVPKKKGAIIGQRIGLSEKDTIKLNKMYCDADSDDEQQEEENDKDKKKKKVITKKPKQIQGLGYHQGKAVVFKVPTATSRPYKFHHRPSPHAFNYFSKTPQILSSSENEGYQAGKDMIYTYKPRVQFDQYEEPVYNREVEKVQQGNEVMPINQQQTHNDGAVVQNMNEANINTGIDKSYYEDPSLQKAHDKIQEPSIIEAIDRLSKIIKAHVYPSQTPDLSIYKINEKHTKQQDNDNKDNKEHVNVVFLSPNKKQIVQAEKMDNAMHFINRLYDLNKHQPIKKLDDQYYPAIGNGYHEDRKTQFKKESLLPQKERKNKYINPSYTAAYFGGYDDYPKLSAMRFGGQDMYAKYAKIVENERSQENDGECHRNIYAPYKYGPARFDDGVAQDSIEDEDRSAPLRFLYIPGTHRSDMYNDMRDREYYR